MVHHRAVPTAVGLPIFIKPPPPASPRKRLVSWGKNRNQMGEKKRGNTKGPRRRPATPRGGGGSTGAVGHGEPAALVSSDPHGRNRPRTLPWVEFFVWFRVLFLWYRAGLPNHLVLFLPKRSKNTPYFLFYTPVIAVFYVGA
jgi:hypothetical protein